jgi:hypothetical protein
LSRAHLEGLLDDAFDERLGFTAVAATVRLDRAQQRRLQRRLVLLQVQRDLFIGDLATERTNEEVPDRGQQGEGKQHAGHHDRDRAEPVPLHQGGSNQEKDQEDSEDAHHTAECEFQTPAPAYFRDDAEEIRRHRSTSQILEHVGPSRLARSR